MANNSNFFYSEGDVLRYKLKYFGKYLEDPREYPWRLYAKSPQESKVVDYDILSNFHQYEMSRDIHNVLSIIESHGTLFPRKTPPEEGSLWLSEDDRDYLEKLKLLPNAGLLVLDRLNIKSPYASEWARKYLLDIWGKSVERAKGFRGIEENFYKVLLNIPDNGVMKTIWVVEPWVEKFGARTYYEEKVDAQKDTARKYLKFMKERNDKK